MSICSIHLILLIAELNDLEIYQADVGNAYLEAYRKDLFYNRKRICYLFMEGHVLIISKALYGLHTSGKWFHKDSTDMLHIEGFTPCKANSDVCM